MQIIKTVGIDGYDWRKMPEGQKYGYVAGFETGYGAGRFEKSTLPSITHVSPGEWIFGVFDTTKDFEKLIQRLDEFYCVDVNKGIYLIFALPIVMQGLKGVVSDKTYEGYLENAKRKSLMVRAKVH